MITETVLFAMPPEAAPAQGAATKSAAMQAAQGQAAPSAGSAAFLAALTEAMVTPVAEGTGKAVAATIADKPTVTSASSGQSVTPPHPDSTTARLAALQGRPEGPQAPMAAAGQPTIQPAMSAEVRPDTMPEAAIQGELVTADDLQSGAAQGIDRQEPSLTEAGQLPTATEASDSAEHVTTARGKTDEPPPEADAPTLTEAVAWVDAPPAAQPIPQPLPVLAAPHPQLPEATAAKRPVGQAKPETALSGKPSNETASRVSDAPKPRKAVAGHVVPADIPPGQSASPAELQPAPAQPSEHRKPAPIAADPVSAIGPTAPQTVAVAPSPPPAPPPAIIDTALSGWETRFTEHLAARLSESGQSIEITLAPETLGPVTITVEMADGAAQVQIVTETDDAARVFQQAEHRLADSMARAGLVLAGQDTSSRNPRDNSRDGRGRAAQGGDGMGIGPSRQRVDALPLQRRASGLLNIVA